MNITECVKKYGKTSFSVQPFGEVDSLILSELSYLDFSFLNINGFEVELRELKDNTEKLCETSVHPRDSIKLLNAIFACERYEGIKIGYFKEAIDETLPKRFAAISFKIDDIIYVAFRGTDITIKGWEEDFYLTFQKTIPSQEEALTYLEEVMQKESGRFIVGGHSKGGNLAVYASMNIQKELQDRIEVIYDHDGPGFHDNIFGTPEFLAIENRIKKTVPHDSIIGMLLEHNSKYSVVKCKKALLDQHDPFTWEVKNFGSFKILSTTSAISQNAAEALREWLYSMSTDERKSFVNALFKIIYSSGRTLVKDRSKLNLSEIRRMWQTYRALPKNEQKLVKTGGKILFKIFFRIIGSKKSKEKKELSSNNVIN